MHDFPQLPMRAVAYPLVKRLARNAALVSTLALGACAGAVNPFEFVSNETKPPESEVATSSTQSPQSDLQKATEYWGKQFTKNPKDPQAAINYVRDLKALGARQQAFGVIQQAYMVNPGHRGIASEYGRLALDQDQIAVAEKLLAQADDPVAPDWKVISARGTVLAKQNKYREAIGYFERARAMAPDQSSVLNNLALAHAMDGHAEKAEPMLREAMRSGNADPKVSQNLALVLELQGKSEEAKQVVFKDGSTEESRDDATLVREMVGAKDVPAPAVPAAPISTGSTKPAKSASAAASRSKKQVAAPAAEDPSILVQRLADGYAATPADVPVQLVPKQ